MTRLIETTPLRPGPEGGLSVPAKQGAPWPALLASGVPLCRAAWKAAGAPGLAQGALLFFPSHGKLEMQSNGISSARTGAHQPDGKDAISNDHERTA